MSRVPFLCDHLQEEHCFDTKNAVCPMCADNPGKDMITHFVMQHSHLLKRRRSHKASLWMNDSDRLKRSDTKSVRRSIAYRTNNASGILKRRCRESSSFDKLSLQPFSEAFREDAVLLHSLELVIEARGEIFDSSLALPL
uniref:Di19 zinc-binding domain-containing protein n=1 Tax=Ananas comosus var. bracteatus TaxID=296719 RepID=A0A6V7P0T4_ANACO|nr:unnamed protein product [Ananas comosus var. bracteatus]